MGARRRAGPPSKCVWALPGPEIAALTRAAQGTPQYIQLSFSRPVVPKRIELTFQGGFVGRTTSVFYQLSDSDSQDWQLATRVFPEDVNRQQSFDLPAETAAISAIKLVFQDGSDFFGRITLYDLQLHGIGATTCTAS